MRYHLLYFLPASTLAFGLVGSLDTWGETLACSTDIGTPIVVTRVANGETETFQTPSTNERSNTNIVYEILHEDEATIGLINYRAKTLFALNYDKGEKSGSFSRLATGDWEGWSLKCVTLD